MSQTQSASSRRTAGLEQLLELPAAGAPAWLVGNACGPVLHLSLLRVTADQTWPSRHCAAHCDRHAQCCERPDPSPAAPAPLPCPPRSRAAHHPRPLRWRNDAEAPTLGRMPFPAPRCSPARDAAPEVNGNFKVNAIGLRGDARPAGTGAARGMSHGGAGSRDCAALRAGRRRRAAGDGPRDAARSRRRSWPWRAITGSRCARMAALPSCSAVWRSTAQFPWRPSPRPPKFLPICTGSISSWPGAMAVPRSPDPSALARELSAALGVLAAARRASPTITCRSSSN